MSEFIMFFILPFIVMMLIAWLFWYRVIKPYKELKYNLRQLAIYHKMSMLLIKTAEKNDIPQEETIITLNALVDTYNDRLQGKDREYFMMEPFPMVIPTAEDYYENRPKGDSKREEPAREEQD